MTYRRTLLTAAELAQELRVTRRWVYEQVESHNMPAYRLGQRALRFDRAAVDSWLETHKVGDWNHGGEPCVRPIARVPLS